MWWIYMCLDRFISNGNKFVIKVDIILRTPKELYEDIYMFFFFLTSTYTCFYLLNFTQHSWNLYFC